jgi:hypothetical protein
MQRVRVAPPAAGTGPAVTGPGRAGACAAWLTGPQEPAWRKSSRSAHNGDCVEFAEFGDGRCGVRDSKDPGGPVLLFSRAEWVSFLTAVRQGQIG